MAPNKLCKPALQVLLHGCVAALPTARAMMLETPAQAQGFAPLVEVCSADRNSTVLTQSSCEINLAEPWISDSLTKASRLSPLACQRWSEALAIEPLTIGLFDAKSGEIATAVAQSAGVDLCNEKKALILWPGTADISEGDHLLARPSRVYSDILHRLLPQRGFSVWQIQPVHFARVDEFGQVHIVDNAPTGTAITIAVLRVVTARQPAQPPNQPTKGAPP